MWKIYWKWKPSVEVGELLRKCRVEKLLSASRGRSSNGIAFFGDLSCAMTYEGELLDVCYLISKN